MEAGSQFDLVVIGSGPGGYIAAIRAGQLGMKVACVEKDKTLGGTCLNVGCIPSKALLESSELYHEIAHNAATHGVLVDSVKVDLSAMMARKEKVVKALTSGVAGLFKKNKVTRVDGYGRIISPTQVEVKKADGSVEVLETKRILIATGSEVVVPRGLALNGHRIFTSTEALELPEVPKHLIIIGAGVIGLELGSVWNRLGAKVTLIELMPRILNGFDTELAEQARKIFQKQGLNFLLGTKVTSASVEGETVTVGYETAEGAAQQLECDRLLVCVGRRPFTAGLGLEDVGVKVDRGGRVEIDEHFQTNVPGIYAIGDVVRGAMLAHKAEEEGVVAVELMNGIGAHIHYNTIPNVVYTWPEIASVGATEDELKAEGRAYKKGVFPFMANGRAKGMGHTDGSVKILTDARTDHILGAHILGPRAGDLIAELVVGMEFSASAEDISRISHAHPTLAEVVKEAALAVDGRPLNI